ncbi:Hypothetical protein UVM_LOCUS376 [uncultured virus]|nr:Hypothetical protein UVM_LOCUS376 [uncultured virus]
MDVATTEDARAKLFEEAVRSYDADSLRELLAIIPLESLLEMKNPLEQALSSLMGFNGAKSADIAATLAALVNHAPALITDRCFELAGYFCRNHAGLKDFARVLRERDVREPDADKMCPVCLSDREQSDVVRLCSCTSGTHLRCLLETLPKTGRSWCGVCLMPYRLNEPRLNFSGNADERVFFPWNDIYPQPLFRGRMIYGNLTAEQRLQYAILFLQTRRVQDLLDTEPSWADRDQLTAFVRDEDRRCCFAHPEDGVVRLLDNMPSNLPRCSNAAAYFVIELLLRTALRRSHIAE